MAKGAKTGGRKKGTPNKSTAAQLSLVEQSAKEGVTPLDVMLRTMRHLWKDAEAIDEKTGNAQIINTDKAKEAMAVAASAAPYCHARIAPKEFVPPAPQGGEEIDMEEAGRRIAFVLAAAEHAAPKALPKPKAKTREPA